MTDSHMLQATQFNPLPGGNRSSGGRYCIVALKALSEVTRLRIIGELIDATLDVTEITERVGISQYNISKHLRVLREAGLLKVVKKGRRHLYALPDGILKQVEGACVLDLGCCTFDPGRCRILRPLGG